MEFSFIKDNSILLNLRLAYREQTLIKLWYADFGTVRVGMTAHRMLQRLAHTESPNKSEWLAHIKSIFHPSAQCFSKMAEENSNSKILLSIIIGFITVIIGSAMLNTAAGIIGGIVIFVVLLCHDD